MPWIDESRPITLCWGTAIGTPLVPLIEAAGSAGLQGITLTAGMYEAARAQGLADAQLRRRLRDAGLVVEAIDPLISALPGTPRPHEVPESNRPFFEFTEERCYAAAEALGAETINLAHFGGGAVTEQAFIDCLGPLAARAQARGVRLTLEFLPESAIPDLATAVRIVRAVGNPHLGLMFDTWHFARTRWDLDELAAVPAGLITGLQISDRREPEPGTPYTPMFGRLLPGEGELDLAALLNELLPRAPAVRVGVEVFSEALRALPPAEIARRVADSTRRVISEARARRVPSP